MAAELSARLGWLAREDVERIARLFVRIGVPVRGPEMALEKYIELMQHDKKVQAGKIRLVLLKRIGQAVVVDTVTTTEIAEAIQACL